MAALFEAAIPSSKSGDPESPARQIDAARVTAGLAYVNRCLRGHRPVGILTGSADGVAALAERVAADCGAREDLHVIRVRAPTDCLQDFLTTCLDQLGFELLQASADDLHNLLVVFLRHEGARGRRTVAIIEDTEHHGPRVLEVIHALAKVRAGATPAITILLAGSRDLHRVLDSPGMSDIRPFARERFDLDRSLAWVIPARVVPARGIPAKDSSAPSTAPRCLTVMLDGAIMERRILAPGRLVIGRSPQCGLRLDSRYVSRHHAVLVVTTDYVTIVDLQSTNATLVNGEAATCRWLEHGDLVAIGNFRVRYERRENAELVRVPRAGLEPARPFRGNGF